MEGATSEIHKFQTFTKEGQTNRRLALGAQVCTFSTPVKKL